MSLKPNVRRVGRVGHQDNLSVCAAFGKSLSAALRDWAQAPTTNTVSALSARLQGLAEGAFPAAYLRGKRQALAGASLDSHDRQVIEAKLRANRQYVEQSFAHDVLGKMQRQQIEGGDMGKALVKAFGPRLENLYGGTLWSVQEAGFASGVMRLAALVRSRPRLPVMRQESLLDRINRKRREAESGNVQATDQTVASDAATVDAWNQALQDEIAKKQAALADMAEIDEGVGEKELSAALGIEEGALADLLTNPGFRVGQQYLCEQDPASCDPCIENANGGQDGDGIYWEPDWPPMPGEDCDGYGNCRCRLVTVYAA